MNSTSLLNIWCIGLLTLLCNTVSFGQCDMPNLDVSLMCEDAPLLCQIECLDGFEGSTIDTSLIPQEVKDSYPDRLCNGTNTAGEGAPNNVVWFAFIAGDTLVELDILIQSCTVNDNFSGLQAGIYDNCDWEEVLYCINDCDDTANDLNFSYNEFVPGRTYYLFLDGCNGSICDFEVRLNSGTQPFEMPEIDTITHNVNGLDLYNDSLCTGTNIDFTVNFADTTEVEVFWDWQISPPTAQYPSGSISDTTEVLNFVFDEEGEYTIIVQGMNFCDDNEPDTLNIQVRDIENEDFGSISVCGNCFPLDLISPPSGCIITDGSTLPSVLVEDPNGDGVVGWQGFASINGPGLDSAVVVLPSGCSYTQYIRVEELIPPSVPADTFLCLEDYPIVINGVSFNAGETKQVRFDGMAANGCDSIVMFTANAIDLTGRIVMQECEAGSVLYGFEVLGMMPAVFDSISYTWMNGNNVIGGDSSSVSINMSGTYTLRVEVFYNGSSCSFGFTKLVDLNDLSPELPILPNITEVCAENGIVTLFLDGAAIEDDYDWVFTPLTNFSFGVTTDTVFVEVDGISSLNYCVNASNGCGESAAVCNEVEVINSISADFDLLTTVCTDSIFQIEFLGSPTAGLVYNWDIGSAVNVDAVPLDGPGPYQLSFATAGTYDISLFIVDGDCTSTEVTHRIEVTNGVVVPNAVTCEPTANSVTFSWDAAFTFPVSSFLVTNGFDGVLDGNSITVSELGSNQTVGITVIFDLQGNCGDSVLVAECMSTDCPEVDIAFVLGEQDICLDSAPNSVSLQAVVTGNAGGAGVWSGNFISENDETFDVATAGVGQHQITYSYLVDECSYTADTVLNVYASPEFEYELQPSGCSADEGTDLEIFAADGLTFTVDDVDLLGSILTNIEDGEITIVATNAEGCSTAEMVTVATSISEDITLNGNATVKETEVATYDLSHSFDQIDVANVQWTLNDVVLCDGCLSVTLEAPQEGLLCVDYIDENGCVFEDCLTIERVIEVEILTPSVINPNTQFNGKFQIASNSTSVMVNSLDIFDRWGNLVYHEGRNSMEDMVGWDGTFNNRAVEKGVYVFVIRYMDAFGDEKVKTGDVTVIF